MSKKTTVAMLALGLSFWVMPPAWADERDDKINALEKKLQELDEKYRMLEKMLESQQKPPPPNEPSPTDKSASEKASTLNLGYKDAFTIRSTNADFVARLRGILQVDSRTFVDDGGIKGNDTLTLRRARPIIEGTIFRDFDFLKLLPSHFFGCDFHNFHN